MTSVPSSESDRPIDTELRSLVAEYLPRLRTLGADLLAALETPADSEACARATKLSHRIHGTAGSYGFTAIAEAAGAIEDALLAADGAALAGAAAAFRTALRDLKVS